MCSAIINFHWPARLLAVAYYLAAQAAVAPCWRVEVELQCSDGGGESQAESEEEDEGEGEQDQVTSVVPQRPVSFDS